MSETAPTGKERRAYRRHNHTLTVQLEVFEHGLSPRLVPARSVNISRGGALLSVDKLLLEGARCGVSFADAAEILAPQSVRGRILYRRSHADGGYGVAVVFDEPLTKVNEPLEA